MRLTAFLFPGWSVCILLCILLCDLLAANVLASERPAAVILIYADDLGYGDLSCYGADKIRTPNIDRLAKSGRLFTDAHSPSAVCTPSRYGLLTGEYPWRIGSRSPVFAQHGLIVDPDQKTLADVFREAGYSTACIGKWHLGFGDPTPNWNAELKPGPLELGFDYYYGVPVVNSHPPFVYVENYHVVGLDPSDPLVYANNTPNPHTQAFPEKNREPLRNGLGFRGAKAAHVLYRDEEVATHLTEKAVNWMQKQKDRPFFLYLATTNIHHPFTPHPRFHGTSDAGRYGDYVHELDWIVGEVTKTLETLEIADKTLVIFTSDNGGMLNQGGNAAWQLGHRMNGNLLGFKFGVWEGGHRVPFIASWPAAIPSGTRCDALFSSMDLIATFAARLDVNLNHGEAVDSIDQSGNLFGHENHSPRRELILQPHQLSHLALRRDEWVYIPAQGSGGFGNGLASFAKSGAENSDFSPDGRLRPDSPNEQLYNLSTDVSQRRNSIQEHPDIAREMKNRLAQLRNSSSVKPLGNLQFNFEDGKLADWRVVEGMLKEPLTNRIDLPNHRTRPFNKQGAWFLFTGNQQAEASGNDRLTGVLESPPFQLRGGRISFLVGGGNHPGTYVALVDANGNELLRASGSNSPIMKRVYWNVDEYIGQTVSIRLVDRSKAGWGHVTFDDFSCDALLVKHKNVQNQDLR